MADKQSDTGFELLNGAAAALAGPAARKVITGSSGPR